MSEFLAHHCILKKINFSPDIMPNLGKSLKPPLKREASAMCKENVAGFNKPTPSKVKFPEEFKKEKVCFP